MKIHDLLANDPRTKALANSGQARITSLDDTRHLAELRAELETFVCDSDGHYGDAIVRILQSYLTNLDATKQDAAWVSGFFGSGKSHLLKMLAHLWVNTSFEGGVTARTLVPDLPQNIQDLLRELDTKVSRSRQPAVAAIGTLPAGSGDFVKMTVLSVILKSRGIPEQYPQACFCFWLQEQGFYDEVRKSVEDAGKDWLKELNNLYVSGFIANAVLQCDSNFASDEQEARKTIREQFPKKSDDITTSEFLEMARKALSVAGDGLVPITILVLDEVQQYIGDSTDRAVAITEIAEAIYTQLDSRVMLVASGQAALSATPQLQKLKDRFRINTPLSDTDVEAVTRKVLLRKNAASVPEIESMLLQNAGEIDKHLSETRIAVKPEDQNTIVADYPLLPSRRRFWDLCFRVVDAEGTQSQLRSQLRILHDALKAFSDNELGFVIPADYLFSAIAPNLVQNGVLLNELDLRIRKLDDGTPEGILKSRICGVVFLISKLSKEEGIDSGVRATARTIADLMVQDLTTDTGPFRKEVETALQEMAADGTLMQVGNEYRMQTTEGADWDSAYRQKVTQFGSDASQIEYKRSELLAAAVQSVVVKVRLNHGASNEKRSTEFHVGPDEPTGVGDQVILWLRDGWSASQNSVEDEARTRGHDDSVVHIFLPRKDADELKVLITQSEAARQILDTRGIPSTLEGHEARESMQSTFHNAKTELDNVIREITIAAKVYKGGGTEIFGSDLHEKINTAAESSLVRLFPEFNEGDHKGWGLALKRSKEGSDEPLKAVDWGDSPAADHPVVRRVLSEIGNGETGAKIRKALQAPPYGWPKDAIDTALFILLNAGAIRADLDNMPVAVMGLDQTKISKAKFYPESVQLLATDKLSLRSLYQDAGISVKAGEEGEKAQEFLRHLKDLASAAGGEAPRPECPDVTHLNELSALQGSEQLGAILEAKERLSTEIKDWGQTRDLIVKREPSWESLSQMIRHTTHLSEHEEVTTEMAAIESNRSLLDPTDLVAPLVAKASNALRAAITKQDELFTEASASSKAALEADDSWKQLNAADQQAILTRVSLGPSKPPTVDTDEKLLAELDHQSLESRSSATAAVSERTKGALEEAARKQEPDAKRVPLRPATLPNEAAVLAWIDEHQTILLEAVAKGPVIVG